jgi:hypothetical protein
MKRKIAVWSLLMGASFIHIAENTEASVAARRAQVEQQTTATCTANAKGTAAIQIVNALQAHLGTPTALAGDGANRAAVQAELTNKIGPNVAATLAGTFAGVRDGTGGGAGAALNPHANVANYSLTDYITRLKGAISNLLGVAEHAQTQASGVEAVAVANGAGAGHYNNYVSVPNTTVLQ